MSGTTINNIPTKYPTTIPSLLPKISPPSYSPIFYSQQPHIQYNIPTPKQQQTPMIPRQNVTPFLPTSQQCLPKLPSSPRYNYTPIQKMALQHFMRNQLNNKLNHIFDLQGRKQSLDQLLQGPTFNTWQIATSNELGRLAQGIRNIQGNDVIDFIHKRDIPSHKKVTYANMVCDYRPLKSEPFRVRLTVGGDRLEYDFDSASPAASLLETKLLINSTISQSAQGCRFITLDIKDFFLQTDMKDHEYMRIHKKYIFIRY